MAERADSTLNGYFRQQHQRRRRRSPTSARLSFLEATISPRYLRNPPPLLSGSELSFDATRKSAGSAVPSAEAAKLTAREDLSHARTPASGARTTQKRQTAPTVREPPPSLNAHPGSGPRAPSLLGEGTQGPIAYRLQSGDRSGLPARHGARYAKERGSKNA
jgi:hypothetical protein